MQSFKSHEFSLLAAIFAVVLLTTLLDSQHNYWHNPWDSFVDIVRQTSLLGIFALGAAIVIIAGGIDLSSGSVICFSGTICASIMLLLAPEEMRSAETPIGAGVITVAILGTMFVGFLIGSLHAWLITVVNLPPFVATLATLVGLRSFARAICESVNEFVIGGRSTQINIFDSSFRYLATSVWIPAVIFLVLVFLGWLMLSKTVLGRHLYALGGNEDAARLSGIRTDRMKWVAYCISAMLSSIAGILYIGEQSVAEPQTLGRGYELNAIAAAVVGGCSLQGGIGTLTGTALGALFLRSVIDGVAKIIKTGADVYEGLIVGVVVVLAVAFSQFEGTIKQKRFFSGPLGLVTVFNLAILTAALTALIGPKLFSGKLNLDTSHLATILGLAVLMLLLIVRSDLPQRIKVRWSLLSLAICLATVIVIDFRLPIYRAGAAVTAVKKLGGTVESVPGGLAADLSGKKVNDSNLKQLVSRLKYLPALTELRLQGTEITDDGIQAIAELQRLEKLDVTNTKVTRRGTGRLSRKLPRLEVVP